LLPPAAVDEVHDGLVEGLAGVGDALVLVLLENAWMKPPRQTVFMWFMNILSVSRQAPFPSSRTSNE
jgi:hypothetical protein